MKSSKIRSKTLIAFKADEAFAGSLDRVVRVLDTDRSKFIRAAVRKEIAHRSVSK